MIYVECDPDEALVCFLGIPRKKLQHVRDKPRVIKKVRNNDGSKGLVDEDPKSLTPPSYIKEFTEKEHEHDIRLLKHNRVESYLIVLCPRLEEWVLNSAKEVKIDPAKHGCR